MDAWRARDPGRVHLQSYEALLCDAEGTIRALLDACGLPFDPACLQFQDAKRSVRTASAAQVRQPLQADTGRRSEVHTSELQSLMRNSYAVFCLKKKKKTHKQITNEIKTNHAHQAKY